MILDTNALCAFVGGDPAVGEVLGRQARACLPVIVLGAFRYGIAQSRHRVAYERWLAAHVPDFEVLPVTEATARAYTCVRLMLKQRGTPIPANDAWIAATAVEHRLPLLSRDAHFDAVAGIERRGW